MNDPRHLRSYGGASGAEERSEVTERRDALQEVSMQGIPRGPAVIILENDSGLCGVVASRIPQYAIANIAGLYNITRREAVATPHFEHIEASLAAWLRGQDRGMPWAMVDFDDLLAELMAHDPVTGKRTELADLAIGMRVKVTGVGKGRIVQIRRDHRYQVKLDCPIGDLYSVDALRKMLKPLVRMVPA